MDNSSRSQVNAIAEYEYTAKEPDELTFLKGAIISSVKEQAGGWWEGTLNGKTGVFPDSFVRLLHAEDKSVVHLRDKSGTVNRRCKAVYSYTQNNDDELSLAVGDVIEFIEEVEEGWWRGKLKNKIGVFPSNFVANIEISPVLAIKRGHSTAAQTKKNLSNSKENLVSAGLHIGEHAPSLPPKPVREMCKVLFPYDPLNEDELELIEGDIVTILSRELPDKGWWKGELKGKIGVFPDNFVTLLSDAPVKEPTPAAHKPDRPPLSSKVITSSKSPNSTTNSHRKDSFGSKDSLNGGSGIISGNVAAHRLSLEHRTVTLDSSTGSIEKPARKNIDKSNSDLRKSLENLDDNRKSTPPPVLTKKPTVPIKKSPTSSISSMTGIFSGLKSKVKGGSSSAAEQKNSMYDSFDGVGPSKVTHIADNNEKGVIGEKIGKKEDSVEFDQVERGSVLHDMRASRVKAPKRRPPSATANASFDSNSSVMNGSSSFTDTSIDSSPPLSHNTTTDDDAEKPKPREWEKHKAPWMAELKSQMKKTSPNSTVEAAITKSPEKSIESTNDHDNNTATVKLNDMSKSFSSAFMTSTSTRKSSMESSNSVDTRADMKSSTTSSSSSSTIVDNSMAKSMSSISGTTKISLIDHNHPITAATITTTTTNSENPDPAPKLNRPLSVNLRNRSISPTTTITGRSAIGTKSMHVTSSPDSSNTPTSQPKFNNADSTSTSTTTVVVTGAAGVTSETVCSRVSELEQRVAKLEKLVQSQTVTIEDLVKTLRDEKDKVKCLKTELDKYAQCVTQV